MATAATQRPVLLQALRNLRSGTRAGAPAEIRLRNVALTMKAKLETMLQEGYSAYTGMAARMNTGQLLKNIHTDISAYVAQTAGPLQHAVDTCAHQIENVEVQRQWTSGTKRGWNDFGEQDISAAVASLDSVIQALRLIPPTNVS